jgi:hypothetical protein
MVLLLVFFVLKDLSLHRLDTLYAHFVLQVHILLSLVVRNVPLVRVANIQNQVVAHSVKTVLHHNISLLSVKLLVLIVLSVINLQFQVLLFVVFVLQDHSQSLMVLQSVLLALRALFNHHLVKLPVLFVMLGHLLLVQTLVFVRFVQLENIKISLVNQFVQIAVLGFIKMQTVNKHVKFVLMDYFKFVLVKVNVFLVHQALLRRTHLMVL